MDVDDVAIDFPKLTILLAHGGRPLWMDAAFFVVRRHPNVHLEVSGIPPAKLLEYFPRLEEIADKTVWGTDWPSPGVMSMRRNVDQFRALPLAEASKRQILYDNAARNLSGRLQACQGAKVWARDSGDLRTNINQEDHVMARQYNKDEFNRVVRAIHLSGRDTTERTRILYALSLTVQVLYRPIRSDGSD